ncbi:MAG TPA: trigger factor [Bacteroidota bacterium]
MDVNVKNLSEVSREIEITATPEEIQPHFDKAYREYQPKLEIKGFRKGKAPLDLVKKMYGDLIENESLEEIASELYRKTVQEQTLKPIGDPVLVDIEYKRNERLWFKIQYDIRPTIQLKEYKGFEVEKPIHTLKDEEVEEEIIRLRRMNSTTEAVARATDDEHIVTGEAQELDKTGFPIIGKKTENARFYLADPSLEQPIKDALKNAEPNGEYRVQFNHQHGEHSHDVNLKINVAKVERVVLPEVDDAFVAKITKDKIKAVDEFRKTLRQDLIEYWNEKSRRGLVNNLVAELLRRHEFEVPESLVRSVLSGLMEQIKNDSPNRQLPEDFDTEQFFQQNRAYAIYQAKWALLREEIVTAEGITLDDSDVTGIAEREAEKLGIDKERLINYYKSSDQVKDRIVGDKLMKLLIDGAKVKEVEQQTTLE